MKQIIASTCTNDTIARTPRTHPHNAPPSMPSAALRLVARRAFAARRAVTARHFATDPTPASPPPLAPVSEITSPSQLDAVVAHSHTTALVFDFYADWCGPCKQLTPMLERAVAKHHPKVALLKLNVEAPGLEGVCAQLKIASLPTVMAMSRGQFVNQFKGAIPEAEVEKFIADLALSMGDGGDGADKSEELLANADLETLVEAAADVVFNTKDSALDDATRTHCAQALSKVINSDVSKGGGPAVRCRALAVSGGLALRAKPRDVESAEALLVEARRLVDGFPAPKELSMVEARVILTRDATMTASDVEVLGAAHEKEPKDFDALQMYASALFLAGESEKACTVALKSVKPGYGAQEVRDQGRTLVVRIIDALGAGDALGEATRKKLASAWFL